MTGPTLQTEALQAAIFNSVNFSSIATDAHGVIQIFNVGAERMLGYTATEVVNMVTPADFSDPAELNERALALSAEFSTKIHPGFEALIYKAAHSLEAIYPLTLIRKDGSRFPAIVSVSALRDADQSIIGYLLIGTDNSAHQAAEVRLQNEQARFRAFFDFSLAGTAITTPDKGLMAVNDQTCRILGYSREELLELKWSEITHPDDLPADKHLFDQLLRNEIESYSLEKRFVRKDGTIINTKVSVKCVRLPDGSVDYLLGLLEDITDRKGAEDALVVSENSYRRLFEAAKDGILILDAVTGKIKDVNPFLANLLGYAHEEFLGKQLWQIGAFKDIAANKNNFAELQKQLYIRYDDLPLVTVNGEKIFVEFVSNLYEVNGEQTIQCNVRDITERKLALDAVRESDLRFRQLAENLNQVFYLVDPEMKQMLYISPAYETIWGRSRNSLYKDAQSWTESIHPDDLARVMAVAAPHGRLVESDIEYRIIRPDGTERTVRARAFPVNGPDMATCRFAGIAEDITATKMAEQKLRQAQRIEAIGRLSGGVAHDFNNLLTVILGHVSMLEASPAESDAKESVHEIRLASERAASLTRQLLLFARQERVELNRLDLNKTIAHTIAMLMRILGEDVQLDFRPAPEPLFVQADAGLIDQVLLNLAVNARDAMPNGGKLAIETKMVTFTAESAARSPMVKPGMFASIAVTDTGCGIAREDLPRIFDPFFTTKEVGKGTGLGLSTGFGIVQQHAGWINAYSEVGSGTTLRIYIPIDHSSKDDSHMNDASEQIKGGNETILLVEDEPGIRVLAAKHLTRLGYVVVPAASGPEALIAFDGHQGDIALVLTDMIMPGGMTGAELAELLVKKKPSLPVIFSSGYSDNHASADLALQEGVNFLSKPFSLPALAQIVRNTLDSRRL